MKVIDIYTDGACSGNPGKGGLGIIMKFKNVEKELSFGFRNTTNNRMELLAVIIALENLKENNLNINIYSDSKYVVDSIKKKWLDNWIKNNFNNGKIKNQDLWLRYYELSKKNKIEFNWVKGHNTNNLNNRCDILAVNAYSQNNLIEDIGYQKI